MYQLTPPFDIYPANKLATSTTVSLFLCPSDKGKSVTAKIYGVDNPGPTNYVANIGSGVARVGKNPNGGEASSFGSPWDADGMFQARVRVRIADVLDGLSNTAAMSESTLGDGPEGVKGQSTAPGKADVVYKYLGYGVPLTDAACASASNWNVDYRRGFTWVTGEMRTGAYNHYYTPNTPNYDCITNLYTSDEQTYTATGFRAARSRHSGGVNVLLADGSVRFVGDTVEPKTWSAIGTRALGEVPGDY